MPNIKEGNGPRLCPRAWRCRLLLYLDREHWAKCIPAHEKHGFPSHPPPLPSL
eukprot:c29892_g1_i1 orf=3-158(-)